MNSLLNSVLSVFINVNSNTPPPNPQLDAALAELADISLGRTPSVWPLAWGWWVLIVVFITALGVLAWFAIEHTKKNRLKRHALRRIQTIDLGSAQALTELHGVLRSTALHYFPNANVNGLQGSAWQSFLKMEAAPHKVISKHCLLKLSQLEESMYTKAPNIRSDEAKNAVLLWIKHCVPATNSHQQTARIPLGKGVQNV